MSSNDGFYEGLCDLQTEVSKWYAAEVSRLRAENAALRKIISEFPSDATAMQDRLTMMEARCALRA